MVLVVREILIFRQFSGLFAVGLPPFALAAHRRIRTHKAASWSDFGNLVVRVCMEDKFKNLVFWSKVTSRSPVLSSGSGVSSFFTIDSNPRRSSQVRGRLRPPDLAAELLLYTVSVVK